ncbi:MAG: BatD family protein [Planctomycetota bacterium]
MRSREAVPTARVRALLRAAACVLAALATSAPLSAAPAPALAGPRAQSAEPRVDVYLKRKLVKYGEPTQVVIQVVSADAEPPTVRFRGVPTVPGLRFGQYRSGPTQRSFRSDSRGRMVSQSSRTYFLPFQPEAAGEYAIPPIELEVGGKTLVLPIEPMELKVVEDIEAEAVLFFERDPLPERVYEGQPFTVAIRFGWLSSLAARDLALHLPWWGRLDGVLELPRVPRTNEGEVEIRSGGVPSAKAARLGKVKRGGDEFLGFEIERRFVATRAGTLDFSGMIFEFEESRRGAFRGKSYYRPVEDATMEVVPIPEDGRPFDFTGAVGAIEVAADADRRDVDAGDVIPFEVSFMGTGSLEFFDAPRLDRLDGFDRFRVLGTREEKTPYERVVTYDLVPLDATLTEIPPVELSVFDPREAEFVRVRSKPIPIRVRGAANGGDDPFAGAPEARDDAEDVVALRDVDAAPRASERDAGPDGPGGPPAGAALGVLGVGLALTTTLRRRARRLGDDALVARARRRRALKELDRALRGAQGPDALSAAFEAFVADRTDTLPERWIGVNDLGEVGDAADGALAADFSRVRGALDAARFSGDAAAGATADDVRSVARRLVEGGAL